MNPQSGQWIGTFTTDGGTAVYLVLELTFANGTITGSFNVAPQSAGAWKGPRQGPLSGGYTEGNEVRMNQESGQGAASFTGIYSASGDSQVIQGNVVIRRGKEQQVGTLVVYSVKASPHTELAGHVWDP